MIDFDVNGSFSDAIQRADGYTRITSLTVDALRKFKITSFRYSFRVPGQSTRQLMGAISGNDIWKWQEALKDKGLPVNDPTILAAGQELVSIFWEDMYAPAVTKSLSQNQLESLNIKKTILGNGVTVPFHGPGARVGFAEITFAKGIKDLRRHWNENRLVITDMLWIVHRENIRRYFKDSEIEHGLTDREIESLELAATGLTANEIADQMNISLSTANRHLNNACQKLRATNRTEAVARALNLSLITLPVARPKQLA